MKLSEQQCSINIIENKLSEQETVRLIEYSHIQQTKRTSQKQEQYF